MQPAIAHIPRGPSGSTGNQRVPRKSSSFLSLRLQRDKPPVSEPPRHSGPPPTPLPKSTYFDAYPRSAPPRVSKPKGRRASPARTDPSCHEPFSSPARTRKDKDGKEDSSTESSYAFPSFDPSEDPTISSVLETLTPRPYLRTRSRTGPSRRSNWSDSPPIPIPSLRFSGSSTRTHFDSPLQTPIDNTSLKGFQVLVAAPISGVETMDALVDGMNGGDDILGNLSNRARFGIPGHHPLYQPPLPTPPPGVVLGGGKSRKHTKQRTSSDSADGDEDDDDNPTKSIPLARPSRRRTPRPIARTPSSGTVIPSSPPSRTHTDDEGPPPLTGVTDVTICRPITSSIDEKPRPIVPSISEIIRTHAPPAAQVRSRPLVYSSIYSPSSNGHATVFEEPESEPEPLTADEEAELLSRSSIDSIADEVRRTVHRQNTLRIATPPIHVSHPSYTSPNRHSVVISDTASYRSPMSEAGNERASIYSSSMSHNHHSFESPSLLALSRTTPSQAVARYLRSARLTTLLKLTRSPHASQDNPLLVSLSDLGSPTGFPLVVFLGLGCVRHIMGLYDEMAECLGLRLITIDR